MKTYLHLLWSLKSPKESSGFTLVELIAACVMTIFIVGAAGYGLMVMLREQTILTGSSDIQNNLNRAVDFIAEEVKQAAVVSTAATPLPSGCSIDTDEQLVVTLTVLPDTNPNVVYYTKTPPSPSTTWLGPSSIYRCGPAYNSSGNADFSSGSPKTSNLLVDSIANNTNLNTCQNGGIANPSANSGFFVCITSTKLVEIQANATAAGSQQIRDNLLAGATPSENTRYGASVTYSARTQVYARSAPSP